MAIDELDPFRNDAVGNGNSLFGIADVIFDHQLDLPSLNAALFIDRRSCGLCTLLELVTDIGKLAGHRTCDRDLQIIGQRNWSAQSNTQ